ncbi:endothelin-converting enzyme homolog isoform X1 [Homalodisca vitripennis]|uniref:endothelin-converting enzyme homolog isoform X1 n=1 Tax=Homalodisca vitripennis TaxID=197043 RepID=UPI001EE9F29F|nr:endothelin-converting enzyme homolog isoform X1 [Homalodisca vitripennis]
MTLHSFSSTCLNCFDICECDINLLMFPGRKILDSVGLFVNATSDPQNDFTELLISLFKHGSEPLFRLQLDVDSTNSSFFQMAITVPDWSSSHFRPAAERNKKCRHKPSDKIPEDLRVAYSAYTNCKNNFSNFMETTQKALEYFGVFDYMDHFESAQLIQEIRISIEFDILELLAELPTPDVVQDSIQKKDYKLIIKPQLEATIPQISWSFLFSTLLNVELDDSSYVQVYFLDEISNFFNKLQTKDVRTVHNSLLAVFAHDLYKDLMLTHSPCDREQYCLHVAASLMPAVVSNLYLGTFPADTDRDLRTQVTSLYSKLKATMKEKLVEADWLDNKTRNQVEKKLNFMSIELPQMFNESFLNTSLEECNLDKKHYMEDSVCLVRQYQTLLYSRYTLNPDSVDVMWPHFLTAFSTHTAFIYGLNTFMIPLAVVGHVYDSQLPRHVVMARLGNILARGLGHNFDYTGIKFDATGKIGIMLSEDTNPSYTTVVDNSNSQFIWTKSHKENSRFYMYLLQPGLTLNQRLSDITAANLSLSTVLELQDTKLPWVPFNSRQVYFIALAQTFCSKKKMPEVFTTLYEGTTLLPFDRITNLVSNSEQFAVAFSCALGANMHPEFKVRPFPLFEKVENTLNYVDTY